MATRKGQESFNYESEDLKARFRSALDILGFEKKAVMNALVKAFVKKHEAGKQIFLPGLELKIKEEKPVIACGPAKKGKAC